ncbi:hypothetical protein ACSW8S_17350 (plasmid) [Clostridium perfringens]
MNLNKVVSVKIVMEDMIPYIKEVLFKFDRTVNALKVLNTIYTEILYNSYSI